MGLVRRSEASKEDSFEIWFYIASDSIDAADALLRAIDERLRLYSQNPHMGTARDELASGLRSFPVGNYLVFYRVIQDGIEVIRVLHAARNLKSHFPDRRN
jgi:toxin ParE1/3/4